MRLKSYVQDFVALFFPRCCHGCGDVLVHQEMMLCTACRYHLPYTNFHMDEDNDCVRQLRGKCDFQHATAMLFLRKSSRVEQIIYQIKYNHHPELATYLGQQYGATLREEAAYRNLDYIIPIPLHKSRLRQRGYNQAAYFAQGLSTSLQVPILSDILIRHMATESQTTKSRTDRYDNVEGIFQVHNERALENTHILLVDDVLTTGATLASAANTLSRIPSLKISVVTLARRN